MDGARRSPMATAVVPINEAERAVRRAGIARHAVADRGRAGRPGAGPRLVDPIRWSAAPSRTVVRIADVPNGACPAPAGRPACRTRPAGSLGWARPPPAQLPLALTPWGSRTRRTARPSRRWSPRSRSSTAECVGAEERGGAEAATAGDIDPAREKARDWMTSGRPCAAVAFSPWRHQVPRRPRSRARQ